MENKELGPIDSTKQITTTDKKTKPKDPGRIAAGSGKIKKFQMKTKMKFQNKDHFH